MVQLAALLPTVLLAQRLPVAVAAVDKLIHGLFVASSQCGPGDSPLSDIVNLSSIAAVEQATFADYITQSTTVTFENSNNSAISGAAADVEWSSFMPSNNGFLAQQVENYTVLYGISAFHGLHCLDTVRRILEVHYDVASAETMSKIQANSVYASYYHIHHCLIYLRELVTCNADPALEHDVYYENGTAIFGGDGTVHTCRNFGELYNISNQSSCGSATD